MPGKVAVRRSLKRLPGDLTVEGVDFDEIVEASKIHVDEEHTTVIKDLQDSEVLNIFDQIVEKNFPEKFAGLVRGVSRLVAVSRQGIAVHWEAAAPMADHSKCAGQVESIRRYHTQTQGWTDIAYSFLVCNHGQIFPGRGWDKQSAATCNSYYNARYWSVCWMGGPGHTPTDAALQGIRAVVDEARRRGAREVIGHRNACATQCPGDWLLGWIARGLPVVGGVPVPPAPGPGPTPIPSPGGGRRNTLIARNQQDEKIWIIGVGGARHILTGHEQAELQFVTGQGSVPNLHPLGLISWFMKFGAWDHDNKRPRQYN